MKEVAEEIYARLTLSLLGSFEGSCAVFFELFEGRYGELTRKSFFPDQTLPFREDGAQVLDFRKWSLRGKNYEGLLSLTHLGKPRRIHAIFEGHLPPDARASSERSERPADESQAGLKSTFLFLVPGQGEHRQIAFFRTDGFLHERNRRYGIREENGLLIPEDVDILRDRKRAHYGELGRQILLHVDRHEFDAAIAMMDESRYAIPEEEFVSLYYEVAIETGNPPKLPEDTSLRSLINRMTHAMREYQGRVIVLDRDEERIL